MLTRLLEEARRAPGPLVILGRPHSGSRLLTRVFLKSGVFMGSTLSEGFLDSLSIYQRFVVPVMTSRFFPRRDAQGDDSELLLRCGERLLDALHHHFHPTKPGPLWGWKYPESLFVMDLVKRWLPGARFVHILRDGRDVCLADDGYFQLTSYHDDPPGWAPPPLEPGTRRPTYLEFCTCVAFGDPLVRAFRGLDLRDRAALVEHRFLIQMQSWIECVTRARRHGEGLGDAYVELRYEDLCRDPVGEARRLFDALGVPLRAEAEAFLGRGVTTSRIRKWERARLTRREVRDFDDAATLGRPLLRELGYAD